jgi:hypothetical protein
MFTTEEQTLLTGRDKDIREFDGDLCMIVDWRDYEEEAIGEAIRFLPGGSFTYEISYPDDETIAIRLRFRDREDAFSLPFQPQNNFRALLRVWRLLQPDYDIKIFRCTDGSDTHRFLLRPSEWWTACRTAYPKQYEKIFRDISDLTRMWRLDASKTKPWWKFR